MRASFLFRGAGLAALLAASSAYAQTVTGSVTGTVTDPTGAIIPNASVAVINVDTGVRTPLTTNASGVYTARFLPIGRYTVEAQAPGFAKLSVPAFRLEIDQTAKIDAHLSTETANTTVTVSEDVAPILDTTDGTVSLSLSEKDIANIPLNGRNFSSATLFQPGSVNPDPGGLVGTNATERNTTESGIVAVNGNRQQANNYTLDGIDLNEGQNNLIAYNPAPDALQELQVISADAPATYGNVNGGDVVAVLKSGTNKFHGSAYEYLESQNLNANTYANKLQNPVIPINPFTQSQFGGTFGGPIVKNKLFFFVDYEGLRAHSGGIGKATVLTGAMRQGNFGALLTAANPNGAQQLYNSQNAAGPVPFSGDANLPINNPVVAYLIAHPQFYPLPNATPSDGLIQDNYQGFTRTSRINNQGDLKIEWDPRTADKITGFYAQSTASDFTTAVLPITFPAQNVFPSKLGGATWVHTFNASIVNEARVGFTRVRWDDSIPTDPTGTFGYSGDKLVGIPFGTQQFVGFSGQNFNINDSYVGTPGAPQILRDNTFTYEDNLTIQRGAHLLSMGVEARRYQQNYSLLGAQGSLGQFNFDGSFTGNAITGSSGYAPADWVLDQSSEYSIALVGSGLAGNRQWRSAGFFQDNWRVTPKLTLNLGLRYEYDQRWNEAHNRNGNVFLTGPQAGTVEYAGSVPAGAPAGSIVCDNISCYKPTFNQLMPRFGFAEQVTPRFVVRGAYGTTSFFEGNSNNQRLTYQSPFLSFTDSKANTPSTSTSSTGATVYNPGQPFLETNGFAIGSAISNANAGFGAWPQNIQPAYVQQYNLTTEYELSNSLSLSVGYVGEDGRHIEDYRNGNQITIAQSRDIAAVLAANPNAAIPARDAAPFAKLVGQGGALTVTESEAVANYNAAELTLRERGFKGLSGVFNYTYSNSLTTSAGNYASASLNDINGQDGAAQDQYNPSADYGPAPTDVRHNISGILVYEIPFGRGREYGAHVNRFVDLALGGWTASGTIVAYSGLPIEINSNDVSNTNTYGQARANHYRPLKIVNRSTQHWFGTDPSAVPCLGADNGTCAYGSEILQIGFGTASVNSERAPGYKQSDISVFKDFHLFESNALGFRADLFNAFNISSYDNPGNNVNNPSSFGLITATRSQPRVIQLSAHYTF